MSSYTIYRLSSFPIDVLRKFIDAKNHLKDKNVAKEEKSNTFENSHQNKEISCGETKKSYFEITSIESSSRMSTNLDDSFNRKTGKVIYMNRIRNYTRGRWNVTDFSVPDFTLADNQEKNVEFVDDKLNVVWTFTSNLLGSARNSKINSADPLGGSVEKSVAQRQPDTCKEKATNDINPVVSAVAAQQQTEILGVCMENSNALPSKSFVFVSNLVSNSDLMIKNKDTSSQKISCPNLAPFVSCNILMRPAPIHNNEPVSAAPDSTNANMSSQPDLTRCAKLVDEFPPSHSQQLSKVNLSTISTLSSQIPILNDHILELNNAMLNLKIENEYLRYELMRIKSIYRPSNGYNSEIIKSDDDSLNLLLEILPGLRRVINLTKLLLPEEIEYISSLKKQ
ncbi:hypothetical protein MXB_590 [Myxobolus squamalis]|nr:hypothetical protein MXB_590 [Myxobolus squamalis]